jgi:hypothetical protein
VLLPACLARSRKEGGREEGRDEGRKEGRKKELHRIKRRAGKTLKRVFLCIKPQVPSCYRPAVLSTGFHVTVVWASCV